MERQLGLGVGAQGSRCSVKAVATSHFFLFGIYQVVLYKVGTSWDVNLERMASTVNLVYDSIREKEKQNK